MIGITNVLLVDNNFNRTRDLFKLFDGLKVEEA